VSPTYEIERWATSLKLSQEMYDEAGVAWNLIDMEKSVAA
jgi:hypothetical protein